MRVPTDNFYSQQLNLISDQYENLNRLYLLQTKKTKILNAADDPVLANRIQSTQNFLDEIGSYNDSKIAGKNRTQVFESSVNQVIAAVTNVKTLLTQAGDETLSDSQRNGIAEQLKGELNKILGAANTQDTDGEYIYAGFSSTIQPYTKQSGNYVYNGSYDTTHINVGPTTTLLYNESGDSVFGNIATGNGSFAVTANSANTGSGYTTAGSVLNSSAYVPDTYTITFVTNLSGKIGYQIIGANSGQVIPAPPATVPANAPDYVAGESVNFNGMTITLNGAPNAGDSFVMASNQTKNVFDSLQDIINTLQKPITSNTIIDKNKQAFLRQDLSQAVGTFNQVMQRFSGYLSQVGVRAQSINTQATIDSDIEVHQNEILHELKDSDDAALATQINQQLVILQATQNTYMQIQSTLLDLLKL